MDESASLDLQRSGALLPAETAGLGHVESSKKYVAEPARPGQGTMSDTVDRPAGLFNILDNFGNETVFRALFRTAGMRNAENEKTRRRAGFFEAAGSSLT